MEFEGATGKLLAVRDRVGGDGRDARGVLYALHLGRFSDTVVRWLYFLVSFMGTAMVGTGLVMWTVKRATEAPDRVALFRLPPRRAAEHREHCRPVVRHDLRFYGPIASCCARIGEAVPTGRSTHSSSSGLSRCCMPWCVRPGRPGSSNYGRRRRCCFSCRSQRSDDATSALAQPGRGRLGFCRHGYHVLGARVAACGPGDTERFGGRTDFSWGARQTGKHRSPSHPAREKGVTHLLAFVSVPDRVHRVGLLLMPSSPAARYHRRARCGRSTTYVLQRVIGACALLFALGILCRSDGLEPRARDVRRPYQSQLPL